MNIAVPGVTTRVATPGDLPAMVALQARAFSPGRFARTAYRVREGGPSLSPFCRVALMGDRIVAALRMTQITISGETGALLLGPLAVDPDEAGRGYGRRLVAESMEAATTSGVKLIVLVGDVPYYGRFGFRPVPPGQMRMPGPVDPARLLAAELQPGALPTFRGLVARAA
jgi:predicted N-acetyltransferase YhbS